MGKASKATYDRLNAKHKAIRESRKRHNLCVGSSTCPEPIVRVWRCERHYAMKKAHDKRGAERAYMRKKVAGLCVERSCRGKAHEHTVLCWRCELAAKSRRDPKKHKRHAANWRRKQVRAGLCRECGKGPLESMRYCETCLEKLRARSRAHYMRKNPNAKRTREIRAVRDIRLEDYMHSGGNNLAEAQR
ncbi:MAG TPA: hypothetical protein VFB66_22200 [Tepidisphaeraceae bacterium]|nr:hypothetical protein [Tepidisphaeraceae bacterium]